MTKQTGWNPLPLSLKILSGVFVFWAAMSLPRLPVVYSSGIPIFGTIIPGMSAVVMVLTLDVLGPMLFLYAAWSRLRWGPPLAYGYNGVFILNGVFAFAVREELGVLPIVIPMAASFLFLVPIWRQRAYFVP